MNSNARVYDAFGVFRTSRELGWKTPIFMREGPRLTPSTPQEASTLARQVADALRAIAQRFGLPVTERGAPTRGPAAPPLQQQQQQQQRQHPHQQ
jgi:hypothetical protein